MTTSGPTPQNGKSPVPSLDTSSGVAEEGKGTRARRSTRTAPGPRTFCDIRTFADLSAISEEQLAQGVTLVFAANKHIARFEDCRDALQEVIKNTLARAVEEPGFLRGSLYSYLLRGARNRLVDVGPKRFPVANLGADGLQLPDRAPSASEEVVREEMRERVRGALEKVSPAEYRTALELAYFEGLDGAEAAARMGKSVASFHMCLSRARRKLAELLHDGPETD